MNRNSHYVKLFLSVLVLILPSVLVLYLGWTNIGLAKKNHDNDAANIAGAAIERQGRDIATRVWTRLEGISHGIANGVTFDDPAVKFVAWVDGDRIALPWEKDPNARSYSRTIIDPAFDRDTAEGAEIHGGLDLAIERYKEMIQSAATDGQQSYARLRLAAILRQSRRTEEAASYFRDLLNLPASAVNEVGCLSPPSRRRN